MGVAAILGLSVVIEIIREWVECTYTPRWQTPFLLRTSYPEQNIFVRIALKALMLLPAIALAWLPTYTMGSLFVKIFCCRFLRCRPLSFIALGLHWLLPMGASVIFSGWFTGALLTDFCHHLHILFFVEDHFEQETDTLGPDERCHILQVPMTDPVRLYRCRHLFERKALIEWIRLFPGVKRRCPSCRERIWTKRKCEAERSAREREGQWAETAPQRAAAAARERSARIENARREQAEMAAARDAAKRDGIEKVRRIVTRAR